MQNIINDFKDFSYIKYSDYVDRKSFPLYCIDNIEESTVIKKVSNKLYINKKQYFLDSMSINDVFTLLLDTTTVSIKIYEQNIVEFLNNSALFLVDFNTELFKVIEVTEEVIRTDILKNYKDKYLSNYDLKEVKIFDQYNQLLSYTEEDNIIKTNFNDRAFLHLIYSCANFKGRALEEFPLTDVSQIFLTKEGV